MTTHKRRGIPAARLACLCAGLFALASSLSAQAPLSVFRPRSFIAGARALGFAEAYVADIRDVNSMYYNPSSLVYMQHTAVVVNHTLDRSTNIMNESAAAPVFMRPGQVLAIGLAVDHVGHLGKSATGDFTAVQYGYDVAYSREIVPTFCVGGSANVRYGTASSGSLWSIAGNLGVFYSPAEGISYGAVFGGIGNGIRYTYDGAATLLSTERLPRHLEVGATMQFPASAQKTELTLSIGNEKFFGEQGLRYKGGAEYVFLHMVALRVGYIVENDLKVATYGLGLRAGRWQVEYGMLPSRITDRLYQFTLAFDFGKPTESTRTDR
jgi:hypothetical protein